MNASSVIGGRPPDARGDREPPEVQREVFDLVRIQGMSLAEAAQVIGVSSMTVRRRLDRGSQLPTEV